MSGEQVSFTLTQGKLSFILAVLALCGTIYGAVAYTVNQEARTTALEASNSRLSVQLDKLSENINHLSLSLREIQVIQRYPPDKTTGK